MRRSSTGTTFPLCKPQAVYVLMLLDAFGNKLDFHLEDMLIAVDCYCIFCRCQVLDCVFCHHCIPLQKLVSCGFLQADLKGGRACRAKSTEDASTLPWLSAVKNVSLTPWIVILLPQTASRSWYRQPEPVCKRLGRATAQETGCRSLKISATDCT